MIWLYAKEKILLQRRWIFSLLDPMNISKQILYILLAVITTFLASANLYSQHSKKNHKNYKKNSKNFYTKRYSKNYVKADKQCDRLREKKLRKKNRQVAKVSSKKPKQRPLAEVDYNDTPPPKPAPKPTPQSTPESKPDIDKMDIDEKHQIEDEVLKKNNLPAPTSAKHEQIRKEVESHLDNFENEKPLKLDPLYFVTGQDEFAFVDMDPFLVAVEYALQGKIVLIEGHTDHVGDFKANVALSIKRVEKIRELMIQMGVHDDHISVVGYGEEHSQASVAANEKQNERRVDFTVF